MRPLSWCPILLLVCAAVLGAMAGGPVTSVSPQPDYVAWRAKRLESLIGTNGWTTLVGLIWLKDGTNRAGSDPANDAVLPTGRAPARIGEFIRTGRQVRFHAALGVTVTCDGRPIRDALLENDALNHPSVLRVGDLSIIVIERGERLGLRVRDPEAPARRHFKALEYYPYDPRWRFEARFEAAPAGRSLRVPDVLGGMQTFPSPGAVVFRYSGKDYRLDVAQELDEVDLFIMFYDLTAGETTYPAGRFLYVHKPDAQGRLIIDFNQAYTPPCGFTPFATCPFPPRQNRLPFAMPAGEKAPPGHLH